VLFAGEFSLVASLGGQRALFFISRTTTSTTIFLSYFPQQFHCNHFCNENLPATFHAHARDTKETQPNFCLLSHCIMPNQYNYGQDIPWDEEEMSREDRFERHRRYQEDVASIDSLYPVPPAIREALDRMVVHNQRPVCIFFYLLSEPVVLVVVPPSPHPAVLSNRGLIANSKVSYP
jgi:hypothetical protein